MHGPNKKQIIIICCMLMTVLLTGGLYIHYETFLPQIMRTSVEKIKFLPFRGKWSNATPTNESWCEIKNTYSDQFLSPMRTNWSDWSYSKTVDCPSLDLNNYPKPRRKVSLDCSGQTPKLVITLTNDTRDIHKVKFGDKCLGDFIDHCCTDEQPVPNVIHHVLFGGKEFGYFPFLSFMSATRFMKPCLHLIHGDYIPSGKYWDYFISITTNVIHVNSIPPTEVFGFKLAYPEHRADVLRIDVINTYGGVYADLDEILLQSIEPLRQYDCTMAELLESGYLGCMFFMAKKNSTFVNMWREGYKKYIREWGHNSQKVPYLLWKGHPDLINVEGTMFEAPGMKIIFEENYNWTTSWATHLAVRFYKQPINLDIIRKLNVMMGALSRHVLLEYGGVYTDWDEVLLKPVEPLRQYNCTLSELLEPQYLGIAFMMAKKNSQFVNLWKDGYREYVHAWGHNSQKVPYLLSQQYPHMIHIEGHNFFKPGMKTIFDTNYNFSTNYGMHLAIRHYKKHIDMIVMRKLNVLMGAVGRHILLGNKDLCENL